MEHADPAMLHGHQGGGQWGRPFYGGRNGRHVGQERQHGPTGQLGRQGPRGGRGYGNRRYEEDGGILPSTGVEYGLVEEPRVASPLLATALPIDPHPVVVGTTGTPAPLPAVGEPVIAPVAQ